MVQIFGGLFRACRGSRLQWRSVASQRQIFSRRTSRSLRLIRSNRRTPRKGQAASHFDLLIESATSGNRARTTWLPDGAIRPQSLKKGANSLYNFSLLVLPQPPADLQETSGFAGRSQLSSLFSVHKRVYVIHYVIAEIPHWTREKRDCDIQQIDLTSVRMMYKMCQPL
jgi:hypothetical protein